MRALGRRQQRARPKSGGRKAAGVHFERRPDTSALRLPDQAQSGSLYVFINFTCPPPLSPELSGRRLPVGGRAQVWPSRCERRPDLSIEQALIAARRLSAGRAGPEVRARKVVACLRWPASPPVPSWQRARCYTLRGARGRARPSARILALGEILSSAPPKSAGQWPSRAGRPLGMLEPRSATRAAEGTK